jgi:hypothetical protein
MDTEALNAWRLRLLMGIGVFLLLGNLVDIEALDLQIPWWISLYLIFASFYFASNPQKLNRKRSAEVLTYFLFPGAFVTVLVPAYAVFLFLIGYTNS